MVGAGDDRLATRAGGRNRRHSPRAPPRDRPQDQGKWDDPHCDSHYAEPPGAGHAGHVLHPDNRLKTLSQIRECLINNLQIFQNWINGFGDHFRFIAPQAGAMAFVGYDWSINSSALIEKLRDETSVMLVAGDWYGMDHYLRFGYGAKSSDLKEALD